MPELPEVETVRTGLEKALKGAKVKDVTLRRKNLRVAFPAGFAKALAGRTITSIERRAKYLMFHLDSDHVVLAHLGMTGRFTVQSASSKDFALHDHAVFHLSDGRDVIYNDARRFGLITLVKCDVLAKHPLLAALGPEPLSRDFTESYLKKELLKRKTPVKVALMDQQLVVGVGNIYASEALYMAGIDPRKPAFTAAGKAKAIIAAIRRVLGDAITSGGSSLRDFVHVSGESGYFQHQFKVYGRKGEPCFRCGNPINSLRQGGRTTFFCADCQH
jgi:formamidopyrimidine-DNA glycosylase